jgi:serine protease AprX
VVRLEAPAAGRYTVQVFARNLLRPPQDFALVVTGRLASGLTRVTG